MVSDRAADAGRNSGLATAHAQRRKVVMEVSLVSLLTQLRGKLLQVLELDQDDHGMVKYLRQMQHDVIKSLEEVLELEKVR